MQRKILDLMIYYLYINYKILWKDQNFQFLSYLGFWCAACMICVILGLNRCIDFVFSNLQDALFEGYKTWLWMSIPLIYMFWVIIFEMPVIFDWYYGTWLLIFINIQKIFKRKIFRFYNPFVSVPYHPDLVYKNTTHSINNILTVFILCSLNVFLCYNIFKLSNQITSSNNKRKKKVNLNRGSKKLISFYIKHLLTNYKK